MSSTPTNATQSLRRSLCLFLVVQCLYINAEKVSNSQEIEGQDGYYHDETPQDWVDYVFCLWMVLHHVYYAYKFTDYSLSHIHTVSDSKKENAREKQPSDGSGKKKKTPMSKNAIGVGEKQPSQKEIAAETKRREKKAKAKVEKAIKEVARESNFTTKSSPLDSTKPIRRAKTVCCCIRCAPRWFTWQRTVVIRLVLRIYTALSCLLAFVLAAEFFMNIFVEFFITCIVHYQQGWIAALLMLPLIVFVIETLLRVSWHSFVIAWQLNCDNNGDIEASNCEGGQHFNLQANQFLFSYREDDDDVEEQYNSSDLDDDESSVTASDVEDDDDQYSSGGDTVSQRPAWLNIPSITAKNLDSNSAVMSNPSPYSPNSPPTDLEIIEESDDDPNVHRHAPVKPAATQSRHVQKSKSDADQMDMSKLGLKLKDVKSENASAASRSVTTPFAARKPKKPRAMTEDIASQAHHNAGLVAETECKEQLEPSRSEKRKLQKAERRQLRRQEKAELKRNLQRQKEEARLRRKELLAKQREDMGDFFLATCWRAWFCVGTLVAAVVASYTLHVSIGTNGLFWQLVMRYCVLGGLIWNVVYGILAFVLCIMARLVSWSLIHPNITRCKFLCLVDAKDHEKRNKGWRNCKICVMSASLVLFAVCVGFGVYLTRTGAGDDAALAGFLIFMGLVCGAYYVTNLAMSCKPMALVALWTDTIPPPGKNFIAHLRISAALQDAGELDNILQVNQKERYSVGTNTELELGRFNSAVAGHDPSKDTYAYRAVRLSSTNTERTNEEQPPSMKRHKNTLTEHEVDEISTATGISAFAPSSRASTLHRTKSAVLFAAERMTALIKRYKKFKYDYKDAEIIAQRKGAYTGCCSVVLQWYKIRFFWNNYKNYWLNVYRPFDEYDMDTNLASTRILMGFQWFKPCAECSCFGGTRKHVTCKKRISKCCQYFMDNTCNLMLVVFFGALIANLFFFATKFNDVASVTSLEAATSTTVITEANVTQYYPMCSEFFGAGDNDLWNTSNLDESRLGSGSELSILDALFLAQVVYEMDNFRIDEMIDSYFDEEYQVLLAQFQVPFHFHIRHKTEAIDFVAIRGTASLEEALQDLSLFVEVALFQGLQWVVPFLNALPTTFVTALIYYSSLAEQLLNAGVRGQFDQQIYDYLGDYLATNTTTSLHLVGHSLGGAIAGIVGANLFEDGYDSHIASFGVCSPGLILSSAKFGFGISALDKTSRSVLPRRDFVSSIDIHGGSVSFIDCNEENLFSCHVTPNVICELYRNCPLQLAKKPDLFDCYCNNQELHEEKGRQQFGDCMNVTECEGNSCFL